MEKINEDIKENKLEHVYLLYGDEQFVVKTYRNRLLKALLGTDSMEELKADLNFSAFVGTAFDVDNAIQMASSFPFMAEKRVVLMENTKVFSRENKALEKCIRNLPDTTYVIFTENEITDKKGLFAAIKEVGHIAEIKKQSKEAVENWVLRKVSNDNKRISRVAMEALLTRTDFDLMRLDNELEKLIAYKGDETDIMVDDIIELVSEDPQEQVFKMIDAMSDKKLDEAMKFYYDMLELKISPQNILRLIERQMKILYQVKDMRKKGFAATAIGDAVKEIKKSYFANKYIAQASKFTEAEITECMKDCIDLNLQSRTGALTDRMAVELIIVKYSSQKK